MVINKMEQIVENRQENLEYTNYLMGWYWSETRFGGSFRRMNNTNADGTISTNCTTK